MSDYYPEPYDTKETRQIKKKLRVGIAKLTISDAAIENRMFRMLSNKEVESIEVVEGLLDEYGNREEL